MTLCGFVSTPTTEFKHMHVYIGGYRTLRVMCGVLSGRGRSVWRAADRVLQYPLIPRGSHTVNPRACMLNRRHSVSCAVRCELDCTVPLML